MREASTLYRKYFQTKPNISFKLLMKTFQMAAKRFVYEYLLGFEVERIQLWFFS